MNKRELHSILQSDVAPKRLRETQKMCTDLLEKQMNLHMLPLVK